MKIVIAGAGDVGFHLAEMLVKNEQDIILMDEDEDALEYAAQHLDVNTILGDCSSPEILMNADVSETQLFIAVTTSHTTNILSCSLAKKLGAKKTIARTNTAEYLATEHLKHFIDLGVDELFSPKDLAVQEIGRLLNRVSATDVFEIENGLISLLGFVVHNPSALIGKPFSYLNEESTDYHVKVVCVLRDNQTLIVRKDEVILVDDHIYIAADASGVKLVNRYIGRALNRINNVMITGHTPLALATAKSLEDSRNVKIIVSGTSNCKRFAKSLNNTLIVKGNPNNTTLLKEEGLQQMDAFIALTDNSETNILSSLMAEKAKVAKTISLVDNSAYMHISQSIGIDTIINKKLLAANEIFKHVRTGRVKAIATFHGVEGEIIEFYIQYTNHLTHKPIKELGLPKNAVVVGIVRDQNGIIPKSDFQLIQGDNIVIFALPGSIKELESIFN